MNPMPHHLPSTPTVWLVGATDHHEFTDAVALVERTASVTRFADAQHAADALPRAPSAPELILLTHSRPGIFSTRDVERLRRHAPLAGIVALLGSWCEGETRTGRPAAGVGRLFWYDFPQWWQRQFALWAAGRCPDWARQASDEAGAIVSTSLPSAASASQPHGLIVLATTCWETGDALDDVLRADGFATFWLSPGFNPPPIRGATAGIWEGRQLDEPEAERLAAFCRRLAADRAPVVVLLDFPRRDRCVRARDAGAAAVLPKPWLNLNLLVTLRHAIDRRGEPLLAASAARAA